MGGRQRAGADLWRRIQRRPSTMYVCTNASGRCPNCTVAAAMFGYNNYLSLPALIGWAQRFWDFWYPPTFENFLFYAISPPPPVPLPPRMTNPVNIFM